MGQANGSHPNLPVAMQKKPTKTSLDNLWSKIVKIRAGNKCEVCGKTDGLNSHHIFSRSNHSTRWDVQNGVCLCVSHHVFGNFSAHKAPIEFVEWLKSKRDDDWYFDLRRRAQRPYKPNYAEVKERLDAVVNSLK